MPLALLRRIALPFTILVAVFVAGTLGYWILGLVEGRSFALIDCAFMTSITLTTVGYGDVINGTDLASVKIYSMMLGVTGMGITLYSVSALTAFIVEGHMGRMFKEERMDSRMEKLVGHTIICGAGETGVHVVGEHVRAGHGCVVVDPNRERLEHIAKDHPGLLYVVGDATDESVLFRAGIDRAAHIVAALHTDKDNLFLVVTARYLAPKIRIVAKCIESESAPKLRAAGANHVVSPTAIGGMRLASQVLRPHVVDFLDGMLRSEGDARVSECIVEPSADVAGKTIGEAQLVERAGLVVVALRNPKTSTFVYSPAPDVVLEPGSVVVVIGPAERVKKLQGLVRGTAPVAAPLG